MRKLTVLEEAQNRQPSKIVGRSVKHESADRQVSGEAVSSTTTPRQRAACMRR